MTFHSMLRLAIASRGRSLQGVAGELRERGVRISASTLSAWQTGVSRPERADSLAALAVLEEVLGLPPGLLRANLPARRPRGRRSCWKAALATRHEALWHRSDDVRNILAKVDADWSDLTSPMLLTLRRQSWIDSAGHESATRVTRIARAGPGGAHRMVFVVRFDTLAHPPLLTMVRGCRPARFRADAGSGLAVFEFTLDRPLREGESTLVEFGLRCPSGQRDTHFSTRIHEGAQVVCIEAVFDAGHVPGTCYAFYQRTAGAALEILREVSGAEIERDFQYVAVDPVPGIYGVRWC
jgi:transcriptional regulator with XRE-family HTH domain